MTPDSARLYCSRTSALLPATDPQFTRKSSARGNRSLPGICALPFFSAQSEGRGILEGVRYIARRQPSGGMPLVTCTASQRGQYLRVPFRARYVFYR